MFLSSLSLSLSDSSSLKSHHSFIEFQSFLLSFCFLLTNCPTVSRLSAALMEAFLTRPKRKSTHVNPTPEPGPSLEEGEESTEIRLAILSSLYPLIEQETLLDVLLAHNGSVSQASESLGSFRPATRKSAVIGHQRSLRQYTKPATARDDGLPSQPKKKAKSKKGSTLHLYDPEDVAEHTPCTIIHNFLPAELADELLRELLHEAKSFEQITFKLFDNIVSSPHTSCLFLESYEEIQEQKHSYYYNGGMLNVSLAFSPLTQLQSISLNLPHALRNRRTADGSVGCTQAHADACQSEADRPGNSQ